MGMTPLDPWAGWIPAHLSAPGGVPSVGWAYMGGERFTDPFCHITLNTLMRRPFNAMFFQHSGLDFLLQRAEQRPGLPLDGIIFHMSRCGSTLAAQWLAALPDSVVLSEPAPVDTLLQWLAPHSCEAHGELLQALLACMGQPRREGDRRLFLKADCWHMGHVQRLLAAFPATPWVFMYRDPLEVLVSQQRMAGIHLLQSFQVPPCWQPPDDLGPLPLVRGAWLLGQILDQAQWAMRCYGNGLLLNYSELPEALEGRLAAHFGVDLAEADRQALGDATRRHSKQRHEDFQPDSAEKRAEADDSIRELAARWMAEPYQALETMRQNHSASQ